MSQAVGNAQAPGSPVDALEEGFLEQDGGSAPGIEPEPPRSALHLVIGRDGEPHVSSDDAGKLMSLTLGGGRYIMEGLNVRVSSATTVVVEAGCILADGRFIRLPSPEVVELENGQIGRNRIDQLRIRYEAYANGSERTSFVVVTGSPSTGAAAVPLNEHAGSILARDRIVDIPICNLPKSGLTPGSPVMLLPSWVWPPANTDMSAYIARISEIVSDSALATAAAWEVVRSVPAALAEYDRRISEIESLVGDKIELMGKQIRQLAAMLANNIASYVLVGDTLAAPSSWIHYEEERGAAQLQYTSYDESTGRFSIDLPLTLDERVEANAAYVDYLMMMNGEE